MPSTGSRSTRRTEPQTTHRARPGGAGVPPGRAPARAGPGRWLPLPGRPGALVLSCVLVVAFCAVLAAWGDRPARDPAGFDLRAAADSSNVDSNSAKAA